MKVFVTFIACFVFNSTTTLAQTLYFPPNDDALWATMSPSELGWCEDEIPALTAFLEASNTKAFLVLKDGKIVLEHYFDDFEPTDSWYWASAGKSLTAFLIGVAQEQGLLNIQNPTSDYLGQGWTSLTPEQEEAITVWHQLTMTSGLNDIDVNVNCTDPECLIFLEEPGQRWAYHNAPYTLLDGVISAATGQTLNSFLFNTLTPTTGINAAFFPVEDNNVCFSNPRDFARFGLLCLNQGNWNGTPILSDLDYFNAMTTTSQSLNEAYGYLWWLNDASSFMLPGIQFVIPGAPMPDAPPQMFAAMGKNGQILNIDPEENLIVIRMGDAPTNEVVFVPTTYNNDIWELLNPIMCAETAIEEIESTVNLYPNPTKSHIEIQGVSGNLNFNILDQTGRIILSGNTNNQRIDTSKLCAGQYIFQIFSNQNTHCLRFVVEE